jgi:hypothetical protein
MRLVVGSTRPRYLSMADLPNIMWLICRAIAGHPAHSCVTGSPRRPGHLSTPRRPWPAQAVLLPWTGSRSSARGSATRQPWLSWEPKWEPACAVATWSQRGPSTSSRYRTLAALRRFLGAKLGANSGRHLPTPGHIRRCQAMSGDGRGVLWEQEAASSNLAIPTRSEHMWILVKIVCGVAMGARCQRVEHGRP